MPASSRVQHVVECPFCGEAIDATAARVSLTLKRANDCFVYWKIHEQCLIDRITERAKERF